MALLGIDIGTTGCKSVVYSSAGEELGAAYEEYAIIEQDGGYEIDADVVWKRVKAVINRSVALSGVATQIKAIGVSSFGESAVPIDREGNTLSNAILYTDKRGTMECEQIKDKVGEDEFISITKVTPHPMYTLFKIMWQKNNNKTLYDKVDRYLLFEDFIIYKLTGKALISYSEAARTGCFDLQKLCYSKRILSAAGINVDLLSKPSPAGTVAGCVLPQIATELGLSHDTVVTTGGQDQICTAIGSGTYKKGQAVCGIGTVECITPIFDTPISDNEFTKKGYCCVPYATKGSYATYAYSYTGGAILKWFRDKLAPELRRECKASGRSVYEVLEGEIRAGVSDLLVLPHFAGAATPYMDINAKGAIIGLSLSSTRGDIFAAIMEGCCYEMLLNINQLGKSGITIERMVATGGGASSRVWLQMKADIFGFPISSVLQKQAGTLGAAIIAGAGVGEFTSIEQGIDSMVSFGDTFYPNPDRRERYLENFRRYERLYNAVKDIYL